MFSTFHPDLQGHSSVTYFFTYEKKLDIYQHLAALPVDHPLVKNLGVGDIFIYPPLSYFTLGIARTVLSPFADPNFTPWIWENLDKVETFPGFHFQIFLLKIPYLFVDVLAAVFLARLFDKESNQKKAFVFWLFNPLTLYSTFMLGQLDLLPTFFVILSIYFAKKKKYSLSLVALGIGGSYKMFPLLFIPVAAFLFSKSIRGRVKNLFIGFVPFVITILPFLGSPAFRQMVLFSPKSQKMLFMNWPVSGAEGIYPFVFILVLLYLLAFYGQNARLLLSYFLSILLLTFSVTHYHPQWFLWITPLLIVDLVKTRKRWVLVTILIGCWLVITLFFEPSLSYGLFYPVFPDLKNVVGLTEILSKYTEVFKLKSIIRSLFAAAAFYYAFDVIRSKVKLKTQ